MTRAEMSALLNMPVAQYALWLERTQAELFRRARGSRRATGTTIQHKPSCPLFKGEERKPQPAARQADEAIPPPPSMRTAILEMRAREARLAAEARKGR
jgi:hypothetical protein